MAIWQLLLSMINIICNTTAFPIMVLYSVDYILTVRNLYFNSWHSKFREIYWNLVGHFEKIKSVHPKVIRNYHRHFNLHYNDVIMRTMAPQITSVSIVYSTVCSDADQGKHQSSASLAFVKRIRRWPVNIPHKGPVFCRWVYFVVFIPKNMSVI